MNICKREKGSVLCLLRSQNWTEDTRKYVKPLFSKGLYKNQSWPMEWVLLGGELPDAEPFKWRKTCIYQGCYRSCCIDRKFFSMNSKIFLVQTSRFYVKRIQVRKETTVAFDHPEKSFTNQTKMIDTFDDIKGLLYIHIQTKTKTKTK